MHTHTCNPVSGRSCFPTACTASWTSVTHADTSRDVAQHRTSFSVDMHRHHRKLALYSTTCVGEELLVETKAENIGGLRGEGQASQCIQENLSSGHQPINIKREQTNGLFFSLSLTLSSFYFTISPY